jgi:hypothetical protein
LLKIKFLTVASAHDTDHAHASYYLFLIIKRMVTIHWPTIHSDRSTKPNRLLLLLGTVVAGLAQALQHAVIKQTLIASMRNDVIRYCRSGDPATGLAHGTKRMML